MRKLGFLIVGLCITAAAMRAPQLYASSSKEPRTRENNARAALQRELDALSTGINASKSDLVAALKNASELDDLTEGGRAGFLTISLAVIDTGFTQIVLRRKYPEIWHRSNIIAITAFSGEKRKQVLLERRQRSGGPLKLVALDPSALLRGEQHAMVTLTLDDFDEGDPIDLVRKGSKNLIRIRHQTKPVQRSPESRTFILIETLISFNGHSFDLVNSKRTELAAEKHVDPSVFKQK